MPWPVDAFVEQENQANRIAKNRLNARQATLTTGTSGLDAQIIFEPLKVSMMMKPKTPLTTSKRKHYPSFEYVSVEGRIFKLNCFYTQFHTQAPIMQNFDLCWLKFLAVITIFTIGLQS